MANEFLSFHAGQRQTQQHLPSCDKAIPWCNNTDCPQSGTSAFSPPKPKPQKGLISPHTSCLFYYYGILTLKLFGHDTQICPGMHTGVNPPISVGLLLLHICTSSSTNRAIVGFKFTWLSFILMSQYRVTAISYPPRVWLCFKNPK